MDTQLFQHIAPAAACTLAGSSILHISLSLDGKIGTNFFAQRCRWQSQQGYLHDLLHVTEPSLIPRSGTSAIPGSPELTGGEYRTRERIHRGVADPRLLAIPTSWGRVAAPNL